MKIAQELVKLAKELLASAAEEAAKQFKVGQKCRLHFTAIERYMVDDIPCKVKEIKEDGTILVQPYSVKFVHIGLDKIDWSKKNGAVAVCVPKGNAWVRKESPKFELIESDSDDIMTSTD